MGFFSWKTTDTDESIANSYSGYPTLDVWMIDNKGNKWFESMYEGYGVFGGKDYYELLAEMNGYNDDNIPDKYNNLIRLVGIALVYKPEELGKTPDEILHPNLVMDENFDWVDEPGKDCEYQGYFY